LDPAYGADSLPVQQHTRTFGKENLIIIVFERNYQDLRKPRRLASKLDRREPVGPRPMTIISLIIPPYHFSTDVTHFFSCFEGEIKLNKIPRKL
jgi:hypothetical protein